VLRGERELIVEPPVRLLARDHELGHLVRPHLHAINLDARELLRGNLVDSLVDLGDFSVCSVDLLPAALDLVLSPDEMALLTNARA
jgi:hypothetical protein